MSREFWLEGSVEGVPSLLQPAAHALLQAGFDLREATVSLTPHHIWLRLHGAASIGFHLRHIAGSMDRLVSYALGQELTTAQREALAAEQSEPSEPIAAATLLDQVDATILKTVNILRSVSEAALLERRLVGKAQRPSTVVGLLFHAAEHSQRHAGQVITMAKIIQHSPGAPSGQSLSC
jgi:uncharacterized damage-inducible protein DinB